MLWAEGGIHGYRFWQRHLPIIRSQVSLRLIERERRVQTNTSDYYIILALSKYKLLSREEIKSLAKLRILNILFDIFQVSEQENLEFICKPQSSYQSLKNNFNLALNDWKFRDLLAETYRNWLNWQKEGLNSYSPNLAPILCHNTDLSRKISQLSLRNMQLMLNGKNTLRDVAVQMDREVVDVILALIPFLQRGYVQLLEVPDLAITNLSLCA